MKLPILQPLEGAAQVGEWAQYVFKTECSAEDIVNRSHGLLDISEYRKGLQEGEILKGFNNIRFMSGRAGLFVVHKDQPERVLRSVTLMMS